MIIEVKAAFPLEWGKKYYTVDSTVKQVWAACVCCDNTGKVTIKGRNMSVHTVTGTGGIRRLPRRKPCTPSPSGGFHDPQNAHAGGEFICPCIDHAGNIIDLLRK